jgi:hypothetical protein
MVSPDLDADPILGKYLPSGDKEKDKNLPGMGGVYNPFNIQTYSYAAQNPVKFYDPDGNSVGSKTLIVGGGLTKVAAWFLQGVNIAEDVATAGGGVVDDVVVIPALATLNSIGNKMIATGAAMEVAERASQAKAKPISGTDINAIPKVQRENKTTGSYTIHFGSGHKYHGKGSISRMLVSAAFQSAMHTTKPTSFDWTPTANDREAFKNEYKRMQTDAVPGLYPEGVSNPINYNILQSPGKAYCTQDGGC